MRSDARFLVNALAGFTRRLAVDRTGLEGLFDLDPATAPVEARVIDSVPAPSQT